MFLKLLFIGDKVLNEAEQMENIDDEKIHSHVLSVAQDMVNIVGGGRTWTPKHLGLSATVHQATRSKELVNLLHQAGHGINYND